MFVVCSAVYTLELHRRSLFPLLRSFRYIFLFCFNVYWNIGISKFVCVASLSYSLYQSKTWYAYAQWDSQHVCPNTFIWTSEIRFKASLNLILHSCKSMISSGACDDKHNKEISVVGMNTVFKVHTSKLRSSREKKLILLEIYSTENKNICMIYLVQ